VAKQRGSNTERRRTAARKPMRQSGAPTVQRIQPAGASPSAKVEEGPAQRTRKIGKRSDPAFRATTFFVRKETQRKASRLLEDQDVGKDLSDLVEELLATWIAEHSNA
jgi:hypothetical protein